MAAAVAAPLAAGGEESAATISVPGSPGLPGSRSAERALEEAVATGTLNLSNRRLKHFPRGAARSYDLSDITQADLSRNRFPEVPEAACQLVSLEGLSLYHNCLRCLNPALGNLTALTYLNLSRNQLSSLPPYICQLPLRVLIVSNNKLGALPPDIGTLGSLRQLDVSSNELQSLPVELCSLRSLRDLNVRRNQLSTLPDELGDLPLVRLDFSCNRVSHIPVSFCRLRHLQVILLDSNPLQCPPAQICLKGKLHIFKYLSTEAARRGAVLGDLVPSRPPSFSPCPAEDLFPGRRYDGGLDSGFHSVDSGSKRWSGNESTDEFSELSFRISELAREPRVPKERREDGSADGDPEQIDFIDSHFPGEEEERGAAEEQRPPELSPAAGDGERTLSSSGLPKSNTTQLGTSGGQGVPVSAPASQEPLPVAEPGTAPVPRPLGSIQRPNSFLFRSSSQSGSGPSSPDSVLRPRPAPQVPDEKELISQVRQLLESRLQQPLPEDLGEALANGVILCQLANQLRPRSVPFIHVPSPAVPKLSALKSRKNVESFLEACRKMGVPEADLCSPSDLLQGTTQGLWTTLEAMRRVGGKAPPPVWPPSGLGGFVFFYMVLMLLLCVVYTWLLVPLSPQVTWEVAPSRMTLLSPWDPNYETKARPRLLWGASCGSGTSFSGRTLCHPSFWPMYEVSGRAVRPPAPTPAHQDAEPPPRDAGLPVMCSEDVFLLDPLLPPGQRIPLYLSEAPQQAMGSLKLLLPPPIMSPSVCPSPSQGCSTAWLSGPELIALTGLLQMSQGEPRPSSSEASPPPTSSTAPVPVSDRPGPSGSQSCSGNTDPSLPQTPDTHCP
ncbi:Leucine-rich repeat and calponin homology domain-containing protein 4 [Sciurus carolinensis]|uniref:Leucine-rich repeat and calponin homology domain-containing protein 4 n=1 Tax=Sciurus carolinensis TaxID=30640 RepID=A0AA41N6G5_SCICA|nr:Leucine-rich repeat and calponin homology domain-containing protein 4 [Sciurus carolinensis]